MAAVAVAVAKHQEEAAGLSCTDLVDALEPLARLVRFDTAGIAPADGAHGDALDACKEDPPHLDGEFPVPESACQLTPSPVCSVGRATRSLCGCPTLQEQGRLESSCSVCRR